MPHTSLLRVLGHLHDRPWAITARMLETIIGVTERETDLEAVAAKLGRPLDNADGNSTEIRGNVAILAVEGPLFRYANLFTAISGASSVEVLARDFQAALDNPQVKSILLNVNSPGGEVDGIQELADQIRAGSEMKPVTAYVDGLAASGGYWLAAAAPKVVAGESALVGSIGVVASLTDSRGAQERVGVKRYEIVSSKSPYKRPDPATDEGRAQILEMVDSLAEIFIGRVAQFRGVSTDSVEQNFGQGKVMIASKAMAAGMVDEIGSYEPLVSRLAEESQPRAIALAVKETPMAETPTPPAPVATPEPTGTLVVKDYKEGTVIDNPSLNKRGLERARIAGILNAPEAAGREQLARTLALDTDLDAEAARKILAAAPVAASSTTPQNPLAAEMEKIKNPKVGARPESEEDSVAAEVAQVLKFIPRDRRLA